MSDASMKKPARSTRLAKWMIPLAVLIGGVAVAEQVVVKSKSVAVQPKPSGMGTPLETVDQNAKLEVLGRAGNWLNVRTPKGTTGYVKEGALAAESFSTGTGVLRGQAVSTDLTASLAGKGIEPMAKEYAGQINVDPKIIERQMARREQISPDDADRFAQEGKIGPYRGR